VAQKAFRDRKAQRVLELEKENEQLKEQLERVESELSMLRKTVLNGPLQKDTRGQQLASPAPSGEVTCETCVLGKDCACLSSIVADDVPTMTGSSIQSNQVVNNLSSADGEDETCGLCSATSCLCSDLGIRKVPSTHRTTSVDIPLRQVNNKRKRLKAPIISESSTLSQDSFPMEMDFTSSFTNAISASQHNGFPSDGCGFCSNGTPCVCRENKLPPLRSNVSGAIREAPPEASHRAGGLRPQASDVAIAGGPVAQLVSSATIASGKGGCTVEPGFFLSMSSIPKC